MNEIISIKSLHEVPSIGEELDSRAKKSIFEASKFYADKAVLRSLVTLIPGIGSAIDILLSNPSENVKDKYYQDAIKTLFNYMNSLVEHIEKVDVNKSSFNKDELNEIITEYLKKEIGNIADLIKENDKKSFSTSVANVLNEVENIQGNKSNLFNEFIDLVEKFRIIKRIYQEKITPFDSKLDELSHHQKFLEIRNKLIFQIINENKERKGNPFFTNKNLRDCTRNAKAEIESTESKNISVNDEWREQVIAKIENYYVDYFENKHEQFRLYRLLAKLYHPDTAGSDRELNKILTEKFKELGEIKDDYFELLMKLFEAIKEGYELSFDENTDKLSSHVSKIDFPELLERKANLIAFVKDITLFIEELKKQPEYQLIKNDPNLDNLKMTRQKELYKLEKAIGVLEVAFFDLKSKYYLD